jgi:hypothetical protein
VNALAAVEDVPAVPPHRGAAGGGRARLSRAAIDRLAPVEHREWRGGIAGRVHLWCRRCQPGVALPPVHLWGPRSTAERDEEERADRCLHRAGGVQRTCPGARRCSIRRRAGECGVALAMGAERRHRLNSKSG